ncbi:MAG: hypothetical protein IT299_10765, partial [Dehalococcoidia bacterium]|nr:hypothetical protein [Dehalococcoidia bacterium]
MPYRGRAALLAVGFGLTVLLVLATSWPAPSWIARLMDGAIAERPRLFIEVAANVGTLVAALIGFWVIYAQLRDLHDQAELSARTARSEHYAQISSSMRELNRIFHERWDLRRYFYEGASHENLKDDGKTAVLLDNVCEIILDFADDVVEQYRALPDGVDWTTWWSYFRYLYVNSPKLRSFLWDNFNSFYPDYILQPFGFVVVRSAAVSGELVGVWTLALPPPEGANEGAAPRSFPWVTTWEMEFREGAALHDPMQAVTARYSADVRVARLPRRRSRVSPIERDTVVARVTESSSDGVPAAAIEGIRGWVAETMAFTNVELVEFLGLPGHDSKRWDLRENGMAAKPGGFAFPARPGRG